jgi:hypothetical protein
MEQEAIQEGSNSLNRIGLYAIQFELDWPLSHSYINKIIMGFSQIIIGCRIWLKPI